tara:strand:- start:35 stop:577 length:543 start_codon:yes stop_codon:yes gene_type:complete
MSTAGGPSNRRHLRPGGRSKLTPRSLAIILLVICAVAIPIAMQVRHVMLAEATWPGSVGSSIYRQGSSYSDRVAAITRQDELAWQTAITVERIGDKVRFDIELRDREGEPVNVIEAQVIVMHPLREALDTPPLPAKSVAPGKYSVAADFPGTGKRRLRFEARTSQGDLFRSEFNVRVPSG